MSSRLNQAIAAYTDQNPGENPWLTAIDGLVLLRADVPDEPKHILSQPSLCIATQGSKQTSFGEQQHAFRAGQALLVNMELPSVGRIIQASPEAPFLGAVVELDPVILRDVYDQLEPPPQAANAKTGSALVIELDERLEDCVLRLVQLLDQPDAIPILAPLIQRELAYWLLSGPYGNSLVALTLGRDHPAPIMRAVHRIRNDFIAPLRLEELAAQARLSLSSFHRQFKAVTDMTPLQYQKQLRLLEARRLLFTEGAKVESAAYATGYESASQFSREYARMFGRPPKRDARATPTMPEYG
ncbi:AraC family transcriptional regulator [Saccharospirillum sp. HFRX-1]|uniref:AraC family transcriptional regulator N-terminal domain-containing protein n=1 Tax=unclassified Saccharospirillum TaxID=2633430 RepID=UPI00371EA1D4